MKTYIRKGIRLSRFQTYPSQHSPGRVHLYIWRRDHRQWVTYCNFDSVGAFSGFFGKQLEDPHTPVTCRVCLRAEGVFFP
jgi:hypothetical protein